MSQGAVTEYLFNLIAKQVEDHGLVVWYDPEQAYTEVAASRPSPEYNACPLRRQLLQATSRD